MGDTAGLAKMPCPVVTFHTSAPVRASSAYSLRSSQPMYSLLPSGVRAGEDWKPPCAVNRHATVGVALALPTPSSAGARQKGAWWSHCQREARAHGSVIGAGDAWMSTAPPPPPKHTHSHARHTHTCRTQDSPSSPTQSVSHALSHVNQSAASHPPICPTYSHTGTHLAASARTRSCPVTPRT